MNFEGGRASEDFISNDHNKGESLFFPFDDPRTNTRKQNGGRNQTGSLLNKNKPELVFCESQASTKTPLDMQTD